MHLTFEGEGKAVDLDVEPRLLAADMEVLFGAVAEGLGGRT